MRRRKDFFVPGALGLTEQAIHLLCRRGAAALADYYIGALPFTFGLLYFWSDMTLSPDATWHCAPAAAGVALLFIWMKFWQVRFCRRLWHVLNDDAPEQWPWARNLAIVARQTLLHASGMVMVPLAALIMAPFGWVYAFYQNLSIVDAPDTASLKGLIREAAQQSRLWPGQNHLLLTIISTFALFVMINVAIALIFLPHLLKKLFDIETAFTLGGLHAMTNTTFLAVVIALTYLCVDPIVKATYALRCFYGLSRITGDDLQAALKPFLRVCLLCGLIWVNSGAGGWAQGLPDSVSSQTKGDSEYNEQLDQTIEKVLQQRRFAWRMPRDTNATTQEKNDSWLARALRWASEKIEAAFKSLDRWLDAFSEWLRKRFSLNDAGVSSQAQWRGIVRLIFYGVGLVLLLFLAVTLWRWLMAKRTARRAMAAKVQVDHPIDINDETLAANDLPEGQWVTMAKTLMAEGDYRKALRAFYLAVLANLGDHGRIVIARYKSNREYQMELARRAHAEPELLQLFSQCMAAFERVWYGMYPVAQEQVHNFMRDQERITTLVQSSP